ncbi:threonine--tRNA ligase [Vulcanisaeta thermophila]|uniref:threonine--tRNA ligase n=1 Tax=Vulcanisaeta thermophila TaxID=867917 RepID=UPI000852A780|nr:threonine--tRNA ligase [Vulcanisaeta thermophila]
MRLLFIHAEDFWFQVREKAIENPEPLTPELERGSAKNALVVFTSVEEGDNEDPGYMNYVADQILDVLNRVKAETLVLYPYAHLSPNLARPTRAMAILNALYNTLKAKSPVPVMRAPFGYYKAFDIKCYGHPLSELSKSLTPSMATTTATAAQPQAPRDLYVILTPNGEEYEASKYQFREGEDDLRALVEKEVFKRELEGGGEPRYLDYCRKFGFEWEPMSDTGHMRYGPAATLMMELVEDYAWKLANELGIPVFKIRGTNMFRRGERAIDEHARLFNERMYTIEGDRDELIMRYAACFQQFAMIRNWVLSYRDLPLGMLEIADSYRYEQPGETVLCFRLRRFYMPDLHIFTRDLSNAMELALRLHEIIFREIRRLGRDYVSLYNVTRQFYNEHRDYLVELARREGKPILVRIMPEQKYYWVLNVEFHIVDELRRPREIATFQFDVGNAQRFGIKYRDENGEVKYPVIIHTAILGSVERYIYALLDTAAIMESRKEVPRLPTWIAPVQVRIIPIGREHLDLANKVASELEGRMIRVDIDDRFDETLSRRIRDAETFWVPYIVVVGDREAKTGILSVRVRGLGKTLEVGVEELIGRIEEEIKGYPRRPLTMPKYLSMRPAMM